MTKKSKTTISAKSSEKEPAAKPRTITTNSTTKKRREVQVVSCPSAFPISNKPKKSTNNDNNTKNNALSESKNNTATTTTTTTTKLLDWHDTAKEIRNYGATAFVGKQKRDFQKEEYFNLTGREKKKQKVPLPILREIKKAAVKREARALEEAKAAGIVLPTTAKSKSKNSNNQRQKQSDSTYRSYGPAPSVGFMKNGVLKVQNNHKKNNNHQNHNHQKKTNKKR